MKKVRGFTLIELMIAITVLAVLLGIGVPSFRSIIQNNRATSTTNDVVAAFQVARSEALKRRQNVTVCRRNATGTACENGTNWAPGWMVIAGGTPIQVWGAPQGNPAITGPNAGVTYTPTGLTTLVAQASVTVAFPGCTGDQQRTVSIAPTGRLNTTRTNCP
ncbi:GspH/FimT family pseudopilin [Azoarcus taiwanensis]|uniref:Type II secretion system protein H n=1 Tax=Azoarcus taiwanensis TaxID=666964 RepID=A0A972F870_9RHOO|nr:GspH/FimT family pseudopilin [Azoarcus taiwanensis]NMG03320.1 prepilin-type N-terminal cleavage/methylation domain-containing protein [Azoarcus taiwanensis]